MMQIENMDTTSEERGMSGRDGKGWTGMRTRKMLVNCRYRQR